MGLIAHPERAEQSFRTAVTENPRYVDGYLHLAALLLEARRASEAIEVLAGLREVDPDNALGGLYERRAREALATS
jgi:predicted Zn-dependent protease